ncbi:MAG: insulinase family protein [Lachnospiraceae bacterium]|nr:insulinase family protein [Lachnospiraceae bacterium]
MHYESYEILRDERIEEYRSDVTMLRHKKSGARVLTMANDDENKVFAIAFRTPPADSTGLPHILEHSVLCGSRKFPSKDPFIELAKGSLNTFLNAMTYPDKTVYPVASCNDRDFANLMDVYMDAVLHPNIYREEKIFRQEGWHYELDDPDGELKINGVVYNEMKGAFSNADEVIERRVKQALFPDNAYAHESGGDPDEIPTLTYEDFLAFHQRYYHPSNSYIFLYGNCDMEERLAWLDREYLADYDAIEPDSEIASQKPFTAMSEIEVKIPITDEQNEDEESCLTMGFLCGDGCDPDLKLALDILEHALVKTPGAPLRQAFLDAGIAADVYGGVEQDLKQNYFSLTAKGADAGKKDDFLRVMRETLERLADEGLDRDALRAGLNGIEFTTREGDTGRFPKGLMIGLDTIGLWLYDDDAPFENLRYEKLFAKAKAGLDDGTYERILREYFLDNPHKVFVAAAAEKGLQKANDAEMARKMAALKESWSEERRAEVCRQTAELLAWQEQEDSPEDIAKIPMLARGDLKREILPFGGELISGSAARPDIFYSDIFTSGICYLNFLFDVGDLPEEDLPYLGLLTRVFGMFDTEHYTYQNLANKIGIESGGLSVRSGCTDLRKAQGEFILTFETAMKVFADRTAFPFGILEEIMLRTDYSSEKRLKELLDENRYGLQAELVSPGHAAAVRRSCACHNRASHVKELTDGIAFYRFLEDAAANFDERKGTIRAKLEELSAKIFDPARMLTAVTCDREIFGPVPALLEDLCAALASSKAAAGSAAGPDAEAPADTAPVPFGSRRRDYTLVRKDEAFTTPAGISFVARTGNFRDAGLEYQPSLAVLKTILSYDYLWNRIRVRGGAYGAMCLFSRDGEGGFVSYRDPNLRETLAVYDELADYVAGFDADDRDMTKFLIGTMSSIDIPLSPMAKGSRNLALWLYGADEDEEQAKRDAVLNVTAEDIRALAPLMRAVAENGDVCVIGNETKIAEAADVFDETSALFSGK